MKRGNLDDLASFACIARVGSFTRAAAELKTSTSNLSHAVTQLEKRLGYRLLHRTSRSVSPTEAGAELLLTLAPALQSIESALDAVGLGHDAVHGTLRITATREGYDAVVRPVLPAFTRAHPHATVEVLIEYGFRDIVADGFDAGIRLGEKLEQDMIAVKVGGDLRMAVVAAPMYLADHTLPSEPRELVGHQCINYRMVAAGSLYAWEFERDGHPLEVRVSGPLTFNEPDLMLDAAVEGMGVAYVLEDKAAPLVQAGRLVRLLAAWTPPFTGFYLYHPSRRQVRPVLSAFIAAARKAAR